jgi:regulator of sirC expression with transglutaminase-like and TPR domain
VPAGTDDPELAAAGRQQRSVLAQQHFARLTRWLNRSPTESAPWQEAADFSDRLLYLTPEELTELNGRVAALLDQYLDRLVKPELRPAAARRVSYLLFAFPDDPQLP